MYVEDKVFQITLPWPRKFNVYIILGEMICLVDTGYGDLESLTTFSAALQRLNLTYNSISLIVNTHAHIDHYGGTALFKQLSGAKIAVHEREAPLIRDVNPIIQLRRKELAGQKSKQVRDFLKQISTLKPLEADILLKDNDLIDLESVKLQVIHTPGHTPGHICLYDAERRLLFSGDHIVSGTRTGTVYVGPPSGSVIDYLASLKRLSNLKLKAILPSHGPIIHDPKEKIDSILEHHSMRERQILEAIEDRERTTDEIAEFLYSDLNLGQWEDRRTRLIRGAVLGRLEKLIHDGLVETVQRGDKQFFRIKSIHKDT